ncbi:DNA polymerase III subunit gamma/tau [Cryobacterium sp. Y11]|uniref:DNA polymerase III subunit gamma/tau n=1 Tax=Cryobacterium sp. Y11 TaxID=2045016 RepID=UPI000CE3EA0C|nr:DNA polymerase III subunit gamma/tau [Cryobacterium sp. Y11]
MNATRDDDALNWAGDDDPTLQQGGGPATPEPTGLPEGWTSPKPTAAGPERTAETDTTPDAVVTDSAEAPQSSLALVGMGILAGMYLLYTIGWFIGVSRIRQPVTDDPVAEFMFSLGAWLAVAAPLVWFGATYWLTTARPRARLVWLLVGVLVLAPIPFIIGSGAGA